MVGITRMKKKDVQTLVERDGAGHTYMKSNIQEGEGKHTNKTSTEISHFFSWTLDTWLFSQWVLQTWDFHIKVIFGLASTFWTIIEWSGNIN